MKHPYPKIETIANIIVKNAHLDALQKKVSRLLSMKNQILSALTEPPPFDFSVTDFEQTVLTLTVTQSGFASRLRFLAPDWVQLLRHAEPEFWQYLAQIKVKVCPEHAVVKHTGKSKSQREPSKPGQEAYHLESKPMITPLHTSLSPQHIHNSSHETRTGLSELHHQSPSQVLGREIFTSETSLTQQREKKRTETKSPHKKSQRLRQLVFASEHTTDPHTNRPERKSKPSTGLAPKPMAEDIDDQLNRSLARLAMRFTKDQSSIT